VRAHVSHGDVKQILLLEMLTRVITHRLREILRKKMEQIKMPSVEPYKQEIARYLREISACVDFRYFNLILGNRPESERYWKIEIKESLRLKFKSVCLTNEENSVEFSLNKNLDYVALFHRIQAKTGVKLAVRALKQLEDYQKNSSTPLHPPAFVHPDVEKIGNGPSVTCNKIIRCGCQRHEHNCNGRR
jgi:hypothetical protein